MSNKKILKTSPGTSIYLSESNNNITKEGFEILFLSNDPNQFDLLQKYLHKQHSEKTIWLSYDLSEIQSLDQSLKSCEIILCDLSNSVFFLEIACAALENASPQAFIMGFNADKEFIDTYNTTSDIYRLYDIITINDGWDKVWKMIESVQTMWQNPAMMSCIEKISVCDVVQMISAGGWTSIVSIYGWSKKTESKVIRGNISFCKGQPEMAFSSNNLGIDSIYDFLSLTDGYLQVIHTIQNLVLKNIYTTTQEILMSYFVSIDEMPIISEENCLSDQDVIEMEDCLNKRTIQNNKMENFNNSQNTKTSSVNKHTDEENNVNSNIKDVSDSEILEDNSITMIPDFDIWWRENAKYLLDVFTCAEEKSFPLRWMEEKELKNLIKTNKQMKFLILTGNIDLQSSFIELLGRDFHAENLLKSKMPVIRLCRVDTTCLYLVTINECENFPELKDFPCIIYDKSEEISVKTSRLLSFGYRTIIGLSEQFDEQSDFVNETIKHVPIVFYKKLKISNSSWESITGTIKNILTILSKSDGKL